MKNLVLNFNSKKIKKIKDPNNILGGKGTNLASMGRLGLAVPPGFIISTEVCDLFYRNKEQLPRQVIRKIDLELKTVEKLTGKKFGNFNTIIIYLLLVNLPIYIYFFTKDFLISLIFITTTAYFILLKNTS